MMRRRRAGDALENDWSKMLCCNAASRTTLWIQRLCQLTVAVLVWFVTPLTLASIRRANNNDGNVERESALMATFQTFDDVGWMAMDGIGLHEALESDFGFYAFMFTIVCMLVSAITTIGFWFMVARPMFHRGLYVSFLGLHLMTLFMNLATQFPEQPGIVLSGAPFLQYACGLTVDEAEPFFCARLCWVWVVMLHFRDHYKSIQHISRWQFYVYWLLMILTSGFLITFLLATHMAYTVLIAMTLFIALLVYFVATLFPERIARWHQQKPHGLPDTRAPDVVQRQQQSEVLMDNDAFVVGDYQDEREWSQSSGSDHTTTPEPELAPSTNPYAEASEDRDIEMNQRVPSEEWDDSKES